MAVGRAKTAPIETSSDPFPKIHLADALSCTLNKNNFNSKDEIHNRLQNCLNMAQCEQVLNKLFVVSWNSIGFKSW